LKENNPKNMIKQLYNNKAINSDLALLILRLGLGILMARHGYEKLQTLLAGATDFPDPLHIGNIPSHVCTVGAEFFCSILLIFGLFSRLALGGLIFCMIVIVFIVSANETIDDREHAILFLLPYIFLFLNGTGKYSLDHYITRKRFYE
jgi:putative oxidoreductase